MTLLSNILWQRISQVNHIYCSNFFSFISNYWLLVSLVVSLFSEIWKYQTTEKLWIVNSDIHCARNYAGGVNQGLFFLSLKRILFSLFLGLWFFYLRRMENIKYTYHHPWRQYYSTYTLAFFYVRSVLNTQFYL